MEGLLSTGPTPSSSNTFITWHKETGFFSSILFVAQSRMIMICFVCCNESLLQLDLFVALSHFDKNKTGKSCTKNTKMCQKLGIKEEEKSA